MSEIREIWNAGAGLYDGIYAANVLYHRSHEAMVDLLCRMGVRDVLDEECWVKTACWLRGQHMVYFQHEQQKH